MQDSSRKDFKRVLLTLPWAVVRFFGRITRGVLVAVGVTVAVVVLGYVCFEEIVETIDSHYAKEIDDYLGIDRSTIARLRDRAYFAQESTLVTEDLKTAACISSPEHRILINDVADVPPLFVKAILASEDKNFFTHEGIDKAAILRAFAKHLLQESRSGASTLTMQIAKHLRGGTGRASTEMEKIGDIVMALRIEREFTRQDLLVKYVNMPYFGRGQYGIEAASRAYFGMPAKELTLPQVAFIVALINKPALPDRSFAPDPLLKTPEQIRDANWAEQARGTVRVLDLMVDQNVIDDVEYARAANLVETSLRKDVLPRGIGCGTNDHFLERVRILYKDRFPITKGGLTISITRDDALQDALAKAVGLTLSTYLARHPDDKDNDQLRAGAFAVEFTGDVLAEVGNVDFKQWKYDVIATGWRQPGSTFKIFTYGGLVERITKEVVAAEPKTASAEAIAAKVLERCTVLDAPIFVSLGRGRGAKKVENFYSRSEPQYRGEISCRIALGRVTQHGGDARGSAGRHQERDRTRVSNRAAEGCQACAAALSDDGHRRLRGESVGDGLHRRVPERRISRDAALRERCLPRGQVAPLQGRRPPREGLRHQGRKPSRPGADHASRRLGGDDRAHEEPARHRADGHGVVAAERRDSGNGSAERRDLEA